MLASYGTINQKGERVAIMEMRKHAAWYLKGLKGNGKVRSRINQVETREELLEILYTYAQELEAAIKAS
ncbi:hypothetical protein GCM10011409_31130 [Lentibacillus populi]|uniref:DUS-like FMN-binding domain-containing protein n=1 Tax=Lentibacillus populi TaxID=1827502 RepID=A0A9W5TZ51_9BACI|nr:hypothetical protein GCM10011409_31130 [Lentibacillus populi]